MRDETTQELPAEEQSASGSVAGRADMEPAEGVLTLVCFKCGKEYFFDDEDPPQEMTCEKCGNTVFRSFFSPIGDEVADDFRDSTERDLTPDSTATDTTAGDIIDLNNL